MSLYRGTSTNQTINGDNAPLFKISNTGGSINDTIYGLGGSDTLNGLNGDDLIYGDGGGIYTVTNPGNDTLNGGNGIDTLYGEGGNDTLNGDAGNDTLNGGADNDTLNGGNNDDTLNGDAGNDILNGGANNDILSGGSGIDTLNGGMGINHLTGGAGGGSGVAGAPGDIYNLTVGGQDTIHIAKGDSPFQLVGPLGPLGPLGPKAPTGFDRIFNFDANNDKLDLPSASIMNNTDSNGNAPGNGNGIVNGTDVGAFSKHSISNGVIKLYNTNGSYLTIDSIFKAGQAYKYLVANCLPENLDKAGAILVNVGVTGAPAPHIVVFEAHSSGGIEVVDLVNVVGINNPINAINTILGAIV